MSSRKLSTVAAGAAIISAGTLISRLLGLVRENMLLNTFSPDKTGPYNSAFMVPDLLYYLLAGGALSAAFIPVFSGYLAQGKDEDAHRTASTIANLMLLAIAVGVVLELIFAPYIVRMVAPGYPPGTESFTLTVSLTRVMCVMVFFTALSGLQTGMLNSYHHFLAPTIVWNVYNIAIIFGIGVLSKVSWLGGSPTNPNIHGAAYGVVLGAICLAAFQMPVVLKHGFRYLPIVDLAHEGARRVLKLFAPVMLGLSLSQINLMAIPLVLGSLFSEAAVTDIRAANRLVLLPLGLFAVAISTAAFPRLAQQVTTGEKKAFRETFNRAVKAIIILAIPSTVGLFILAEPMTGLLWSGKKYDFSDIQGSAFALSFFALGLLGISAAQLINRAFYSLQDTVTPVLIGVGMVLVNLPLAYMLAVYTPLQYGGIALSTSITSTVGTLILFEILRKRLGGIGGRSLLSTSTRVLVASILMGGVMYVVAAVLAPERVAGGEVQRLVPAFPFHWPAPSLDLEHRLGPLGVSRMALVVQVGASAALGILVYLGALWTLRVEELNLVTERILGRFRKRPASV